MEKRLSRYEYIFSLVFILMLVCAVGAFFYGVKVGAEKTEAKYDQKQQKKTKQLAVAYSQQDLVSFYHTVLTPYREFQSSWFEKLDSIALHDGTTDAAGVLNELQKLADSKFNEVGELPMPEISPLLQNAQTNFLKSLKLFSEASGKFIAQANGLKGSILLNEIDKDAYFIEAKNFALQAESEYYEAIVKWHQSVDADYPEQLLKLKSISLTSWKQAPLTLKNKWSANLLQSSKYYVSFDPQDLTARIDELILSGQAGKMKLTDVQSIVDLLVNTDAVRKGDFVRTKDKLYKDEKLPSLPFFNRI